MEALQAREPTHKLASYRALTPYNREEEIKFFPPIVTVDEETSFSFTIRRGEGASPASVHVGAQIDLTTLTPEIFTPLCEDLGIPGLTPSFIYMSVPFNAYPDIFWDRIMWVKAQVIFQSMSYFISGS
jgi:hypothetical protein